MWNKTLDRIAQGKKVVTTTAPSILIVEDSPDDLFILKRAFRLAGTPNGLNSVENGQEAIDYLSGTAAFKDRLTYPFPSLVLLDLKLPIRHGLEVIILTSSSEDKDVSRAYDLGANAFLVKPASAKELTELVRSVDLFWLRHNKYLPQHGVSLPGGVSEALIR